MSEVTIQKLESGFNSDSLSYRESFEESLKKAIHESCCNVSKKLTDKEIRYMEMYMQGELTHEEFELAISRVGEKIACNIFCNGNMIEFNDLRRDLKAIAEGEELAESGYLARVVSVEDGKVFQDHNKGTHAPSHSLHLNNGLGDNAGFVSRFNRGYVWRLYADGFIRELKVDDVKMLFAERYTIIPSSDEAQKIADILNRERRILEGQILQGDIGDSPTTKDAISIITNEGKKKGLAYDKTDQMGREARKKCQDYDHEIGKIVGKTTIEGATDDTEQKYSRHVAKFVKENNMNADNFVEMLLRALPKYKRK